MRLLDLFVVGGMCLWIANVLRHGGRFDHAWVTLFLGLGMMLSRTWFALGALLACVSFGLLSLPLARLEWARATRARGADDAKRS